MKSLCKHNPAETSGLKTLRCSCIYVSGGEANTDYLEWD